jgi:phosphatidylglycerol---prolipoprotein diacylglyceryl transferase
MLPVLYKFTFDTPASRAVLYLLAVGLAIYGAYSGWRGAESRKEAPRRAVIYGVIGALVAVVGMQYALPSGVKPLPFLPTVNIPVINFDFNGPGKNFGAPLHTYGILIASAFVLAIFLASREALRAFPEEMRVDGKWVPSGPIMRDHILDLAFYVLVSGLVGSRILFIIVNWKDYKSLGDVVSISGGLVWYGGFIGATLTVLWYCIKYSLPFLRFADLIMPVVSIAHAIGRFACFSAGCCWGKIAASSSRAALRFPSASNLPFGGFGTDALAFSTQVKDTNHWVDLATGRVYDNPVPGAVRIADEVAKLGTTLPVHPTQLYESLGEICLFSLLLLVRREKRFNGQVFATWLCAYSILRSTVEIFRGDEERGRVFNFLLSQPSSAWWNLSTSQLASVAIFAAGLYVFLKFGRPAMASARTQTA